MGTGSTLSASPARSRTWLFAFVLLAATAVLFFSTARRAYFYDSDTSTYLELARSLVSGQGYVFDGEAHTKFPPGIALLLTPWIAWGEGDFALLYSCAASISLVALVCALWWFRARVESGALLLVALCAASAAWYEFSTGASLSEAPFALLLLLLLAGTENALRTKELSWIAALAGGALVLGTVLLRSAGLAVLAGTAATVLHLALRREKLLSGLGGRARAALVLAPATIAMVLWVAWCARPPFAAHAGDVGHESSYLSLWALADPHWPDLGPLTPLGLLGRSGSMLMREGRHVAEVLSNSGWISGAAPSPLVVAGLLAVLLGWRAEFLRANPLAAWVALFYSILVALWPYDEGRRFVMPFVPMIFLFGLQGLRSAVNSWKRLGAARVGAILASVSALFAIWVGVVAIFGTSRGTQLTIDALLWTACCLAGLAVAWSPRLRTRIAGIERGPRFALAGFLLMYAALGFVTIRELAAKNLVSPGHPMRQEATIEACRWIEQHTSADARVLATNYAAIRYVTRRRVALLPVTKDRARLSAALLDEKPDYVVINEPRSNEYFFPPEPERLLVLQEILADRLVPVERTERCSIWRVLH